jgi:hypothetical protein
VADCKLHVAQVNPCSESHVHAKTDDSGGERSLKAFIGHNQRFALKTDDAAVDHVKSDEPFDRLIGVDQRERDLIASANDTVAHALLFSQMLDANGRSAACINGSGLLVSRALSNHGQTLEVSSKIEASSFEEVNLSNRPGCCLGYDVLVAQERPASNRVFAMAAIVGLLK